jgi:hypothetical protein
MFRLAYTDNLDYLKELERHKEDVYLSTIANITVVAEEDDCKGTNLLTLIIQGIELTYPDYILIESRFHRQLDPNKATTSINCRFKLTKVIREE